MHGFTAEFFPYGLISRLTYFIGRKPLENASLPRKAFVHTLRWSDYFLLKPKMLQKFAGGVTIKMRPNEPLQRSLNRNVWNCRHRKL